MKPIFYRAIVLSVVMLSVVLPLSAQGLYWEITTTMSMTQLKTQTYYMPKMFKNIGGGPSGDGVFIFRLDREVMYEVYPEKKTYAETSFAELETAMKSLTGKMDVVIEEMKKRMQGLSPEQKKMIEQAMGSKMQGTSGMPTGEMQVTNTDETQTINGFRCTKYIVKQGDDKMATIWATRDVKEFEAMRNDFAAFSQRLAFNKMASSMAAAIKRIDGFPIQTENSLGMKQTVTKVEKRDIPRGEFEPPTGYTKVESELLKGR